MKAFPQLDSQTYDQFRDKGMDLRDYFAAKAMQALISSEIDNKAIGELSRIDKKSAGAITSTISYEYADAMMEARK